MTCPCKQKLTDGEKSILTFGLNDFQKLLTKPNEAAIGAASVLLGKNTSRVAELIALGESSGSGGSTNYLSVLLPSLLAAQNKLTAVGSAVSKFDQECAKYKDPKQLTRMISSLNLYGQFQCALGIEGVDIGIGLNMIQEDGRLSINALIAAQVDMEALLNQISPGAGTELESIVASVQAAIGGVFDKIDAANAAVNGAVDAAVAKLAEALSFIDKVTSINLMTNIISESDDPCNQLSVDATVNLVDPQFTNTVRSALTSSGGTSFR
jgi:division protein CdvB (Snf7/Vps24/ESCRT-III family)